MQIMIKVSDVSNEARPMEVAEPWLDCLLQEFFIQVNFIVLYQIVLYSMFLWHFERVWWSQVSHFAEKWSSLNTHIETKQAWYANTRGTERSKKFQGKYYEHSKTG